MKRDILIIINKNYYTDLNNKNFRLFSKQMGGSFYIAPYFIFYFLIQVKDCGIKGYEAYNHGKGKHPMLNCPLEKEEPIKAAFKHYLTS